jgi:hypothetical protein
VISLARWAPARAWLSDRLLIAVVVRDPDAVLIDLRQAS